MRTVTALLLLAILAGPLSAQVTKAVARPVPSGCRCGPTCECPVCDGSCGRPLNAKAGIIKTQLPLICYPWGGGGWQGGFNDRDRVRLQLFLGSRLALNFDNGPSQWGGWGGGGWGGGFNQATPYVMEGGGFGGGSPFGSGGGFGFGGGYGNCPTC